MTTYAFAAYVSSETTFEIGQTVVFDSVITNVGGAYDSSTGTFTVPVHGTCLFSVSVKTLHDVRSEARISQNGSGKATLVLFWNWRRRGQCNDYFRMSERCRHFRYCRTFLELLLWSKSFFRYKPFFRCPYVTDKFSVILSLLLFFVWFFFLCLFYFLFQSCVS